ncbi:MAG: helix-turn-helix domain-containing protein [Bacillota bacterium]|nr:helix-turn-helix domain-containing protein [Bacillota bacterium]
MTTTLRERRLLQGLSQAQVAEKTGLSQVAISLFENGHINMVPQVAVKLADALGCSPTELLESQIHAVKSAGEKVSPQVVALLDVAKKAAAVHPLAGAAVAREALRLHKAATKAEQGEPDRDLFGRKREPVKVERDQFGRVKKSEAPKRDAAGRVMKK